MKLLSLLYMSVLSYMVLSKNVANLEEFKESLGKETHDKRDAKNVYNLDMFKVDLNKETKLKREAKNTFDVESFRQKLADKNTKRSNQQIFSVEEQNIHENLLQSILPQLQSISIFAGYIRDNSNIALKTADSEQSMIIIAPSDFAITHKLGGFKPWEFPTELKGDDNDDKIIERNLQNFLNGHIIINFVDEFIAENNEIITTLINGEIIRIKQETNDEFKVSIRNTWINVEKVSQVENGYIFIINDTLVKP